MAFSPLVIIVIWLSFVSSEKRDEAYSESSCNQEDCLRCDLETTQCMKCVNVMDEQSRHCLQSCPTGLDPTWSRLASVHGKVCSGRSVLSLVSQKEVSIIAGASVGGAVCVGIFLGLLLLRRKGTKSPPDSPIIRVLPRMAQDKRPKAEETAVKGKEREEFLAKLRPLRSEAPYILRMMAETRTRFRGFTGPDAPSDTKAKACRAVVRDLSRVLSLVSQKEEHLRSAPKDWRRLISWTERLLVRYKRQQELKNTDGTVPSSKSERTGLFVTRQEKALQERRRWNNRAQLDADKSEQSEALQTSKSIIDPFNKDASDFMSVIYIPETPNNNDVAQIASSQYTNQNVATEKKKKKKDLMKFNLSLWSKFLSSKESTPDIIDLEKGDEIDIDQRSDFIQSQTFFDHIEAFAFDMDDQFAQENEVPTKTSKTNNQVVRNDSNNNEKNDQDNDASPTIKDMNWRNLQIKALHCPMPQKKSKRRPCKIRRISSSILLKGKWENYKKSSVASRASKKRRPLTRQKQVEKGNKEVIHSKYLRNKDYFSSENGDDKTCQRSETSKYREGNTDLLRPNSAAKRDIQQTSQTNLENISRNYDQNSDTGRVGQSRKSSPGASREVSTFLNEVILDNDMYIQITRKPIYHHPVVTEHMKNVSQNKVPRDPGRERLLSRFEVLMDV